MPESNNPLELIRKTARVLDSDQLAIIHGGSIENPPLDDDQIGPGGYGDSGDGDIPE